MKRSAVLLGCLFAGMLALADVPTIWAAPRETVLFTFTGGNGGNPASGVVMDAAGNLYGTTYQGGKYNAGVIFELTPRTQGEWTETVLHNFTGGYDGAWPYGTLSFDNAGNLYGTTIAGGGGGCNYGCGTVFELSRSSDGKWKEQVIFVFNGKDGESPYAGVVFDGASLYGTTQYGGHFNLGSVFKLTPAVGKRYWQEEILHSFSAFRDGTNPSSAVTLDTSGAVYGTTPTEQGSSDCVVFRLEPAANGQWKEKKLYDLGDVFGACYGALVVDTNGNVFGTTVRNEVGGAGTVFELTPSASRWKLEVLFDFNSYFNGLYPEGGLVLDKSGSLYGTTASGGYSHNENGVVFKLSHSRPGWKENVLYNFSGGNDGSGPIAGVVFDTLRNVYGTTYGGGNKLCQYSQGCGTVFQVSP